MIYHVEINGATAPAIFTSDRQAAESAWDAIKNGDRVRTWNESNFIEYQWRFDAVINAIEGGQV